MICSHCGRPWQGESCRLPGRPIEKELASKAPAIMLKEDPIDEESGRNPEVLTR